MAINAAAVWRIRTDGSDENGAGYDATISGAGTDYSDQAASQLALTDLATSGAGVTTLTSVTGGFTSAMIGNAIRIRSGTNFQTGYYYITARTDTNTVTLDRTPSSGAAGSGGSGKVGGAALTLRKIFNSANAAGEKCVAGNTVYVRGAGSDSPSADDYATTSNHFTPVSGDATSGFVKVIGYNGRPRMSENGLFFYNMSYFWFENLFITATGATNASFGLIYVANTATIKNCVLFTNNQAALRGVNFESGRGEVIDSEIYGHASAPTASSGADAVNFGTDSGGKVVGCYIHHMGGKGVVCAGIYGGVVADTIIYACEGISIDVTLTSATSSTPGWAVKNDTIDAGKDHGVQTTQAGLDGLELFNTIISNHVGSGKKGLAVTAGTAAENDRRKRLVDYNDLYNNTANYENVSAGANDLNVDPEYTSAAGADWSVGTNLKAKGFPGAGAAVIRKSATYSYVDIGAAQREEPAAGGGLLVHPGMSGGMRG